MAVLEVERVCKNFGGVAALRDVSLALEEGRITALIGPNGSGKTTLINVVTKFLAPDSGKIVFRGERIDGLPPDVIASRGIIRTFQILRTFKELTVLENVMCGAHCWSRAGVLDSILPFSRARREEAEIREQALSALRTVGLADLTTHMAGALPLGHQRSVELARALAGRPKLLLLDEPVSGLNPEERDLMEEKLVELSGAGVTILFVEHEMKTVMKLAHKIVVLNFGENLAVGTPDEIRTDPRVVEAYLGREA